MTARRGIAALAIALAALLPGVARAQDTASANLPDAGAVPTGITQRTAGDSALEAKVRSVASQLRCPVCQGLSLQDSPSELSQEMRDLVREQLRAGKSPDEVKQYFVGRYGEWILLDPQAHGFNWVVYLLPVGVLVVGGAGLAIAVRRWTTRAPSDAVPVPALDDEAEPSEIA